MVNAAGSHSPKETSILAKVEQVFADAAPQKKFGRMTAAPPNVNLSSSGTAAPPDVRRGYAPPEACRS